MQVCYVSDYIFLLAPHYGVFGGYMMLSLVASSVTSAGAIRYSQISNIIVIRIQWPIVWLAEVIIATIAVAAIPTVITIIAFGPIVTSVLFADFQFF